MEVPIKDLGRFGVNQDIPAHRLPANAWTDARGVRFYDNSVWKAYGETPILGTPTVPPLYIYRYLGPSSVLWAYPGSAAVYATDGTTHANISRLVGGPYTGDFDNIWQGSHLGGIEVFNNGKDDPQAWINPGLGSRLVDLANWPANTSATVVKSFKQYLVAGDITKVGVRYPFLVKWSHVADPGTVPISWDETDPSLDAGEYPLAESGGFIQDMMVLGDTMYIYKEDQTWAQNYIGGRFIFSFKKRFDTGAISPRCIVERLGKHYVATAEDIIVHDGFQQESVLDDRMRRWYDGQADAVAQKRQFMVLNDVENELWMCIPRSGVDHPDVALIINFKDGTQTLRDLPEPAYITRAPFDNQADTTYDAQLRPFDQMQGVFGQRTSKPGSNRLIGAHPKALEERFLLYDEGFTAEGADKYAYCERASMPIAGVDQRGQIIMDSSGFKLVTEVWPEIRMQNGTVVDIYVGGQETLNQAIQWQGPFPFVVGVDDKIDCDVAGRYLSFRFETNDQSQWKLDSYTLNLEPLGRY